jgi:hypothetical protein
MSADSDRIGKFIRMLGSSADAEVLKAARDLASELKADGFDLHTLAAAWETERERHRGPRPTSLSPVDWVEVETTITRYADGKTTMKMSAVLRAVHTAVPAIEAVRPESERVEVNNGVILYVISTLRRLGFTPSPSWLEFHRTEPDLLTRATEDQQATAKPARVGASLARRLRRRPRPTPLSPIDWVEVEAAITRYADGKTTVEMSAVLGAVQTAVPAIEADRPESERVKVNNEVVLHVISTLRRLGFTSSPSWLEFHRTEPDVIAPARAGIISASAGRRWRRPWPRAK